MMKNILAAANATVLEQFAWSKVLLAFDYDGTLAPIVTEPHRAELRDRTRTLLAKIVDRYPAVVISGRARADVAARLRGAGFMEIVGNHGMEGRGDAGRHTREVRCWCAQLSEQLRAERGIVIEDKGMSLAIHYRRSRTKRRARAAIRSAIATLGKVRVIGGKQVVNVLPVAAPHKGVALERLRARYACDTAIYVGDDETDEDVFSLDQPGRLLSIRVGRRVGSHAAYFIRDQREIDRFLRTLLSYRPSAIDQRRRG